MRDIPEAPASWAVVVTGDKLSDNAQNDLSIIAGRLKPPTPLLWFSLGIGM